MPLNGNTILVKTVERKHLVLNLQKGLTQKEIADLMGVYQPRVSVWLNGVRMPNSAHLHKLAEVLSEDPEVLTKKLLRIAEMN